MHVSVILLLLVHLFCQVDAAPPCDPVQLEKLLKWDPVSRSWQGEPSSCFKYDYTVPDTVELLQGKTFLFVGDSTVRNVAQVLVASLCNPDRMLNCVQRLAWPFMQDAYEHAMNCTRLKENQKDDPPEAGWCNDKSRLNITFVPLRYLTSANYTLTRRERKQFWYKGLVPALLRIEILGITIMVLEASCIKQNDGLHRALKWLIDYREAIADGTLNHNATDDAGDRPVQQLIPNWDVLITSAGFHCTYHEYQKKPGWYGKIGERLTLLKQYSPIVWLEASNCTKGAEGHTMLRAGSKTQRSLNVHKYAACTFMQQYSNIVRKMVIRRGFVFSPTFFLTKNITSSPKRLTEAQEQWPCVFADLMHPGVKCYKQMLQVHLNSIRIALGQKRVAGRHEPIKQLDPSPVDDEGVEPQGGKATEPPLLVNVADDTVKATAPAGAGGKPLAIDEDDLDEDDTTRVIEVLLMLVVPVLLGAKWWRHHR